ncbi:MAG: apolipoprotein N-acyltransferase, partial [Alphaproteobacteria bacterium]
FWNSLHVISSEGDILATYDKSHLVPFGEYVPFRNLLKFTKITEGLSDFTAGAGPVTLELDGLPPFSPLICYETIFPGEVVAPARRPAWLVNVTNDAWFGTTSGPFQHFASARLRAVEEGLPLVRAANTGISAIVDPYGRVVARLGLNRTGVLDGPLPQALRAPPPYARWGDAPLAFLIALGALALILMGLRRPRLKRER